LFHQSKSIQSHGEFEYGVENDQLGKDNRYDHPFDTPQQPAPFFAVLSGRWDVEMLNTPRAGKDCGQTAASNVPCTTVIISSLPADGLVWGIAAIGLGSSEHREVRQQ
jgi:hypothetical protein